MTSMSPTIRRPSLLAPCLAAGSEAARVGIFEKIDLEFDSGSALTWTQQGPNCPEHGGVGKDGDETSVHLPCPLQVVGLYRE